MTKEERDFVTNFAENLRHYIKWKNHTNSLQDIFDC